ncbi:hypothetical protein SB659_18070 [Arthrobacter sp. SIMBA_036]|uniref:hypothetical protein n=1 Tax=Arthrobacter sp. SIMBA_036 TaxID=3085778 RepID=UPI00397ACD08
MGFENNENEQRQGLKSALSGAQINVSILWMRYFSIGGSVGEYEVEAYLQGLLSLPGLERDLLAMAANELTNHTPATHAPYADEFPANEPDHPDEPSQA